MISEVVFSLGLVFTHSLALGSLVTCKKDDRLGWHVWLR